MWPKSRDKGMWCHIVYLNATSSMAKVHKCKVMKNFAGNKLGPILQDKFEGKLRIFWKQK